MAITRRDDQSGQSSGGQGFNFQDYYNQVRNYNTQNNQISPVAQNVEPQETRELTGIERLFAGLGETADSINDLSGFSEARQRIDEEGLNWDTFSGAATSFLASLPTGIAQAPFSAAAKGYEAFTGTPVQDADLDAGTITTEQLTGGQRAAVGADALIEGAGTLLGGTGRILGAGARAGQRALGREASNIGAGWVTRAGGGRVAQIGSDILEEGAEEFAQAYLEDIRYDQLDEGSLGRALEGAALGALGGGIMSGTATAINYATRGNPAEVATDPTETSSVSHALDLNTPGYKGRLTPSAYQAANESFSLDRELPGTASFTNVPGGTDLSVNDGALGIQGLRAMFYANDQGKSAQTIAEAFGQTVEVMDAAFKSGDVVNQINQLITASPAPITMTVGRNPDTGIGTFTLNLKRAFEGSGIEMNRMVYQLPGADVDGDKSQVYFSRRVQSQGYPTAQLRSPESGVSRVNWDYAAFSNTDEALKAARASFTANLEQYLGQTQANNLYKQYSDILDGKLPEGMSRDEALGAVFDDMRNQLAQQVGTDIADTVTSMVMNDLVQESSLDFLYQEAIESTEDSEIEAFLDLFVSDSEYFKSSGDLVGKQRLAEFLQDFGYMVSSTTTLDNPFFRQMGQIYYRTKKVDSIREGMENIPPNKLFDKVLAMSMRLRDVGNVPETAIEGAFRVYVRQDVLAQTGINLNKLNNGYQLEEFQKTFRRVYNDYVKTFNDALQATGVDGEFTPITAPKKQNINSPAETARAFGEIFATDTMGSLFDVSSSSWLKDYTVEQLIDYIANSTSTYTNQLSELSEEVNDFWRRVVVDYGGKSRALESTIKQAIGDINVGNLHTRKSGNKFSDQDWAQALYILDAYNLVLDPSVALYMGLGSPDTILDTQWGRYMFSENIDDRYNAILSATLSYQFESTQEAYKIYQQTGKEQDLITAKEHAIQLDGVSKLHHMIVQDFVSDNDLRLLNSLTSLDTKFSAKEAAFNDLTNGDLVKTPLLVNALKTQDSDIAVSAISTRMRKARTSLRTAERVAYDNAVSAVESVKTLVQNGRVSGETLNRALKALSNDAYVSASIDVFAGLVYDSSGLAKQSTDKGTTIASASMNFQQMQYIVEGGPMPWMTQLMGRSVGRMSVSEFANNRKEFLKVFFDPNHTITLYDPDTNSDIVLDQKRLYQDALGVQIDETGPKYTEVLSLLERYPQLATWLTSSSMQTQTIDQPSVKQTMAQPLDKAIVSWIDRNNDAMKQDIFMEKQKIGQMLLNRPKFYDLISASIQDIDSKLTPQQIREETNMLYHRWVNTFYEMIAAGDDSGSIRQMREQEYKDRTYEWITEVINDAFGQASTMNEVIDSTNRYSSQMIQSALRSQKDTLYAAQVAQIFNDYGVEFENVEAGTPISDLVLDLEAANSQLMDLYAVTAAFLDDPDMYLNILQPSTDLQNKIDSQINSIVDENLRNKVQREVARAQNPISQVSFSDLEISNYVFLSQETQVQQGENEADVYKRVVEKIERIARSTEYYSVQDLNYNAIQEAYTDNPDMTQAENEARKIKLRQDIQVFWNNKVASSILERMSSGSTLEINKNLVKQTTDARQFILNTVDELKQEGATAKYPAADGQSWRVPDLYYANPTNAAVASAALIAAESGNVASMVGIDGSLTKTLTALSWLPRNIQCPVEPTAIPVQEILSNPDKYIRSHFRNSDGMIGSVNDALLNRWRQSQSPNDTIEIYLHEDCGDGACKLHNPEPLSASNQDYLSIPYIAAELSNYAAEPKILKSKKRTGVIKKIVDGISQEPELTNFSINASRVAMGGESARQSLVSDLQTYRTKLANFYNAHFQEAGDALAFDMEEAITLSQFTTPVLRVTMVDGSSRMISTNTLATEQGFSTLDVQWDAVTAIKPVTMSLTEIASKIARDATPQYYAHIKKNNSDPSVDTIGRWAEDAFRNWDSYASNQLSARDVLSQMISMGKGMPVEFALADSETAVQRFFGEVYPELANPTKKRKKAKSLDPKVEEAAEKIKYSDEFGGQGYANHPLTIVRGFIDDRGQQDNNMRRFINEFSGLGRKMKSVSMNDGAVITYSTKRNTVEQAYRYAEQNGLSLFVPVGSPAAEGLISNGSLTGDSVIISNQEFLILDPQLVADATEVDNRIPKAEVSELDPRQIYIAVADYGYLNLPDAGHWIAPHLEDVTMPTDGTVTKDLRLALKGSEPIFIAGREDLANVDVRDNVQFPASDTLSRERMIESLEVYLEAAQQTDDAVLKTDIAINDTIALVKQNQGGKIMYSPIILDNSLPQNMRSVALFKNGTSLDIFYQANIPLTEGVANKLMLNGESYKSYGKIPPADIAGKWYTMGFQQGSESIQADIVFDGFAEKNRLFDMNDNVVLQNLWYFGRRTGYSLFHQLDDSGNWQYKQFLAETIEEGDLVNLTSNEFHESTWRRVSNGEILLSQDAYLNGIIQRVTTDALIHKIPPQLIFSSIDVNIGTNESAIIPRDVTFQMALQHLSRNDTLRLFNAFDPRFCPDGTDVLVDGSTLFDINGNMKTEIDGGDQYKYVPARVGPHYWVGDTTYVGQPSDTGNYSMQHVNKRSLEAGLVPDHVADAMDYAAAQVGYYQGLIRDGKPYVLDELNRDDPNFIGLDDYIDTGDWLNVPFDSAHQIKYRKDVANEARTFESPIAILESGESGDIVNRTDQRIVNLVEQLNDALSTQDFRMNLSYAEVNNLYKLYSGYSFNDGYGSHQDFITNFESGIKSMAKNIKAKGILIDGGTVLNDRVSIAMMPKDLAMRLFESPVIKTKFNDDFDQFISKMQDQMTQTLTAIEKTKDPAKRSALYRLADFLYIDNGLPTKTGHIWGETRVSDIIRTDNVILQALAPSEGDIVTRYEQLSAFNEEKMERYKERQQSRKYSKVTSDQARANHVIRWKDTDYNTVTAIMKNASAISKTMALMSPMLLPANVIERAANQGIMNVALGFGSNGFGPYANGISVDQNIVKAAAKDEMLVKIYTSYRLATFDGSEREFLTRINTMEELDAFLRERHERMGTFEKFQDKVHQFASGGDFLISGQIRNFINRFAQRAGSEGHDWWSIDTGDGVSYIEQRLANDPGRWLIEVLGAGESADMTLALQSMNWAKRGDMAQRNLLSLIYSDVASRMPAAEFLTTTFVSKFFQYATNHTGRVLNWVAPVSSLNYLATEWFAQTNYGQTINAEDVQIHASLKEALIVDTMHLGAGAIAGILVALTGIFEPPEDENKWGNYEEWTIFGIRVGSEWWIEDLLGPALPIAVMWKSVQLGKPRLDALFNGLADACYSNPALKVADAISVLFDPDENFVSEYNQDALDYVNAEGGEPSMGEWWSSNATSFGLSWISQFITPSVVREWYNDLQDYEHSYKRIYEEDATGQLTEEGAAGKTQRTTYADAQIRKVTRKNPIVGFIMDTILQPNTGYMAHEMPRTVYYDPEQLESVRTLRMYNEDGTEKTPQEKDAIGLLVISKLSEYDDMEELYREGFMIDYETRAYVSSIIWDTIQNLTNQYNQLIAEGGLDYYTLGDGDFSTGQQLAQEIKNAYYEEKAIWESLYYDKLWSEPMKRGVATYNRYNTTYAQDDTGEWYATGFKPTTFLPFVFAPGETTEGDYQYTMSRENDWATESQVTGNSTGQRALVPVNSGYDATPSLSSWSADGSGDGYSPNWSAAGGSSSNNRSGGYGGYGYSRGGGGGGGGYSPSLYSRVSTPNMPTPRVMNSARLNSTQYDYLRPNFETKGSREAYKRSDI